MKHTLRLVFAKGLTIGNTERGRWACFFWKKILFLSISMKKKFLTGLKFFVQVEADNFLFQVWVTLENI